MKIPTVSIDRDGVRVVINKSDFQEGVDKLWGNKKDPASAPIEVPKVSKPVAVHKGGGRWIVEADGKPVHEDTLTKAEAKALVAAY
jgi:hypothetical protein